MIQLNNRISTFFLIALITFFLGCASTSKQEGTGEYFDDTVVTTKVKAEAVEVVRRVKGVKSVRNDMRVK